MQTDRTLKFWDTFHEENDHQEWISQPSTELLDLLVPRLHKMMLSRNKQKNKKRRSHTPLRILEIGCGTSTLSRCLLQCLLEKIQKEEEEEEEEDSQDNIQGENEEDQEKIQIHICATDVSQVCIDTARKRGDEQFLLQKQSSSTPSTKNINFILEYHVLNVLDADEKHENNNNHEKNWDVILDKGVVDTFLFRSKSRGENHIYTPILEKVLNNIWCLMSNNNIETTATSSSFDGDDNHNNNVNDDYYGNLFIVISPRSKLKAIRDFSGFTKVERHPLRQQKSSKGELVGDKRNSAEKPAYVYICHKDYNYNKDSQPTYKINYRDLPNDDIQCPHCKITFGEFRNGETVDCRGVVFWTRQWKGHCIHCKAPHQSGWT